MQQLIELAAVVFGRGQSLNAGQMSARALLFFFITLLLIRIAGRRSFGQRAAFDMALSILLGAVLSRAVVGATPMLPVISACFALALMHRVMAWLSIRFPLVGRWMDGETRRLVRDQVVDQREMAQALLSGEDLAEAARQAGKPEQPVQDAWLERSGRISLRQPDA